HDPCTNARQEVRMCMLKLGAILVLTPAILACDREKVPKTERSGELGAVNFPTSARSEEAQSHFQRGVAALHSFWYEVALEEFQEATRIEDDFAMGYWGEAMAHNHPIWGDPQETEAAREALRRIPAAVEITDRERGWLDAVKILYGEGEKPSRDRAYAAAMEEIHRKYPEDIEAALFFSLALMGTVSPEDPAGEETRLWAGAIADEAFEKHPDHPGAAHYVIHAYDDPENAAKALEAARRYAEIAPEAPHALHMPSHIFLQLGMWPAAAASNEASWSASNQWVEKEGLPVGKRDYHSLHWLLYVYLQQGRYREAEKLLAEMRETLPRIDPSDPRSLMFGAFTHAMMASTFVVETERWDSAENLLTLPGTAAPDAQTPSGEVNPLAAYAVLAEIPAIFARGLAHAAEGAEGASENTARLRAIRDDSSASEPMIAQIVEATRIQEQEILALSRASKGEREEAIQMSRDAAAAEEATAPPPGPPPSIKPAHELLAEVLLSADRPEEASKAFETSLDRHEGRARSLLGLARAAARGGDREAARKAYERFASQWRHADAELAELREAREFLSETDGR
ncbi:MAG: hypothetical protein ACRD3V_13240, partial [Vicinamibacteria bacterium]